MSNQRPGKYSKPLGGGMNDMLLKNFFKEAAILLNKSDEDEAAFYFEQVQTALEEGDRLSSDPKAIQKMLGL